MKKHKEKARGGTALVTALGMEVHRQGGGGATKQRVDVARRRGAPDSNVCTALVTAVGWRCTGQGVVVPPH